MLPGWCCITIAALELGNGDSWYHICAFRFHFWGRKVNWNQASHVRASSVSWSNSRWWHSPTFNWRSKMVSDFWKEDDFIQDEVTIPDWTAEGRFILKAFSDSSWADCKTIRRVDLSQWITYSKHLPNPSFNGTFQLRGWVWWCRVFSCIACASFLLEMKAKETATRCNRDCTWTQHQHWPLFVQLELDVWSTFRSSSSFFEICCVLVFSIFKVHTKLNPGDLNTKGLGEKRRRFLQSKWCKKKWWQHNEKNPQNESCNKRTMCPFDPNGKW